MWGCGLWCFGQNLGLVEEQFEIMGVEVFLSGQVLNFGNVFLSLCATYEPSLKHKFLVCKRIKECLKTLGKHS